MPRYPVVHIPRPASPADARVTLDDMVRAHRTTTAFLWAQRTAANPAQAPLPPQLSTPSVGADTAPSTASRLAAEADPPHAATVGPQGAHPRGAPAHVATPHALRRFVTCTNCSETFTPVPKANGRPTRRVPPTPRVVSWLASRRGTASLSAIARRFNLSAAALNELLRHLAAERIGVVLPNRGRGGGRQFVLLRTPRRSQEPTP